jgi:hypothetical protein
VPETNPYGAIISIGGQQINNSAANFTVTYGTPLDVLVTVAAGPVVADYAGLQLIAYSPCDGGEGNVPIPIEADFQSNCTPISIYAPADNWLVNDSSNNQLAVTFSGYNSNNDSLINIGLEYLTAGGFWEPATIVPIPASALTGAFYRFIWDVTNIPDGAYQIRAYANCGVQPGGKTYSQVLSGNINRQGLALFGLPTPSDGVLNVNDVISVTFNNPINCAQAAVYTPIYCTLVRSDNGDTVPSKVTCNGETLLIQTVPDTLINSLNNVTLTATIANVFDLSNNPLQTPIVWSFLVNRSKVYWNPANLNITTKVGATASGTATMINTSSSATTFTLSPTDPWLSPTNGLTYNITSGSTASPSTVTVPFTVASTLNPGTYIDTVIATVNGNQVYLFVTVDVVAPGPHWSVNPSDFQYSMNITTNYSKTSLNAPLSSDTRDSIAVFVGNECRGWAGITYDAGTNTYSAFITAYSHSVVGDTFTFRMWDALPGIEYQAKERLLFLSDGAIGQPLAPYILHPAGEFETIDFKPGWNWFSLNVTDTSNMSPANVLRSITGNNGAVVKTQDAYAQYNTATSGWTGTLNEFSTATSYMIYLDHADTLHFLGQPTTQNTIVQIASGWNWVGFPRQKIATATSYLSNTNPSDGDILRSQTDYTQYSASTSTWAGMQYMYPGEGYKLKSANAFSFTIPPDRGTPSWNVNPYTYQQNLTVTADLQFNGVSTTESHYLVGAFTPDGTCVSVGQPQYLAGLNIYRVFLTVHGDSANTHQILSYKVWDTDNDLEFTPKYDTMSVVPDSVAGRVEAPYVINVQTTTGINAMTYTDGYSLLQNVPNPFSKSTTIQYVMPAAQHVTITLYDESGRLIGELVNANQEAGKHEVSFVQNDLESGVYLYQMKSGDFVKTRRMLILK